MARRRTRAFWIGTALSVAAATGCGDRWDGAADPYDLDFDIPCTADFAASLTEYGLYAEPLADLQPAEGAIPYELSSELFTDYAAKDRLLKVPEGASVALMDDASFEYPEGTVLAKTFFYPHDMRDPDAGARVLETRLLIKAEGTWNVATYLWNDAQSDATLLLEGTTTEVSWIDERGQSRSTEYAVPHEGQCVTCHQAGEASALIGPTPRNLNRAVTRASAEVNQLAYLREQGVLADGDDDAVPTIPNYENADRSLESRARAYLDINCAHCHNPDGWSESAEQDFDFRYETPLAQTGLVGNGRQVRRQLQDGEMPFLGTTVLHDEGVRLVLDYVASL